MFNIVLSINDSSDIYLWIYFIRWILYQTVYGKVLWHFLGCQLSEMMYKDQLYDMLFRDQLSDRVFGDQLSKRMFGDQLSDNDIKSTLKRTITKLKK